MQKPNILLVFSDQHRWCDLGCYGNPQIISPNFDGFAQKAAIVTGCISNCPVCVPARGSLLTALYPVKHGAITNDLPIKHEVESIAHVMDENGYHTGYIGKWHLAGIPRDGFIPEGAGRLGFKEWKVCNCSHRYRNAYYYDERNQRVEVEGYEPAAQTGLAVDFIRRNRGKTWGLVLSWGPPHDPYFEVPEKYLEMYGDVDIKLRDNVPGKILKRKDSYLDTEQIAGFYKGYYAHITALDEQFGRIVKELEESGQLENTIIVYTSDHGDMLGSQGLTDKQLPYEEAVKVPLMVYWKGKTVHTATDEMIGLVDLPASLLGLAGMCFRNKVDGVDLHKIFTEKDARGLEESYIFDIIPCHQACDRGDLEWRGLRTRQYTYARTASDDGYILYDNRKDPLQRNNLISRPEYARVKRELAERLDTYISRHDKLLPWAQWIWDFGLKEEWNRSQVYFNRPVLDEALTHKK